MATIGKPEVSEHSEAPICICTYIYMCICIYVHMYISIFVYASVYICIYVCTRTFAYSLFSRPAGPHGIVVEEHLYDRYAY